MMRNLAELRLHRKGLELEILKTELNLRSDVRNLAEAVSLGNLLRMIREQLSMVKIVGTTLGLAQKIFRRRKQKRNMRERDDDE